MTERPTSERTPTDRPETSKRPWSAPVIDVIAVDETEGPTNGFPHTDSITGVS
jgi:hypothetical protein